MPASPTRMASDAETARSMPGTDGRTSSLPLAITTSSKPSSAAAARAGAEAECQLGRGIESGLVVLDQRSPSTAVRRCRGDRQLPAERFALVEHNDLRLPGERGRALEARGPGSDDRDGSVAARRSRVRRRAVTQAGRRGPGGASSGLTEHSSIGSNARQSSLQDTQGRISALATGQKLRREVGIGDQRPCDADEIGAGCQGSFDLAAAAERLRDEQRAFDQRAHSRDRRSAAAAPRCPCP